MVRILPDHLTKINSLYAVVRNLAMAVFVSENSKKRTSRLDFKLMKSLIIGLLLLVVGLGGVSGATYYSRATGNWDGPVWSTTSGGTAGTASITSSDDVIIQTGNTITVNVAAVCYNLTINSGATLTVSGTNTLTVSNNWTNNGIFTSGSGTVNLIGNNSTNIDGSSTTNFYNLTINKGAATTSVTNSSKVFSIGNNLTVTQGNLILQSVSADYNIVNDLIVNTNGTLTHSVAWDVDWKLLSVGGNISIDGKFTYTKRSLVQMSGINKTIRTGPFPSSFEFWLKYLKLSTD